MVYGSGRRYCSLCVLLSGIALVVAVVACIAAGVFNNLIKRKIEENVELKEGSETLKNWKSPSSPVYMQYFMFNLTNAHDVQNGTSKPSVKQVGPYSYREIRHNVPRYFNHSTDTIVYFSEKAYVFDSATSCAGCDPVLDKVYTINIPLLKISQLIGTALNKFVGLPAFIASIVVQKINAFLEKEKVFHYRSVHELLWGYEDYILATLGNFTALLNKQLEEHGFKKLHIPPLNSYVQLQTNNSNTSAEIHTGVGNIDRLGQYVSWNNFRTLPWWNTKWANMINGTDASMFHPSVSKEDRLKAFVSDVCRSIYLIYDSTIEVRGISLYRFFAPREVFTYTADARAGFCVPNNLTCVPDGLLDISVCQPMRVPIVISLPHFLFANESVINSVDGMHPNKEDHAPFVSVEPNTGLMMKANKRIQINVAVDKVDNITQLEKLRKVYLPVLFVNESAKISEEDAEKFKKDVILPKDLITIGKYILIGVGCLIMIIGLFLLRLWNKRIHYKEPFVQARSFNDEDNEKTPLNRSAQNFVT